MRSREPLDDGLVRAMTMRFVEYLELWLAEGKPWQLERTQDFAKAAFRRHSDLVEALREDA